MSKYVFINGLYLMAVSALLGFCVYAYQITQTGNFEDLKYLYSLYQNGILPSCSGGGCSSSGGDESLFSNFTRQTDQGCLVSNFNSCYKMEVPAKTKIISCHYQHISCSVHLYMFKIEGSPKELKMMASNMGCTRINSNDKTIDKAAAAFASILPGGWRNMRLYKGVKDNGYDLRIYLDEDNGCAYIAEQKMSNVVSEG